MGEGRVKEKKSFPSASFIVCPTNNIIYFHSSQSVHTIREGLGSSLLERRVNLNCLEAT